MLRDWRGFMHAAHGANHLNVPRSTLVSKNKSSSVNRREHIDIQEWQSFGGYVSLRNQLVVHLRLVFYKLVYPGLSWINGMDPRYLEELETWGTVQDVHTKGHTEFLTRTPTPAPALLEFVLQPTSYILPHNRGLPLYVVLRLDHLPTLPPYLSATSSSLDCPDSQRTPHKK